MTDCFGNRISDERRPLLGQVTNTSPHYRVLVTREIRLMDIYIYTTTGIVGRNSFFDVFDGVVSDERLCEPFDEIAFSPSPLHRPLHFSCDSTQISVEEIP